jgi:Tol biopolymer transport system component
VYVARRNGVAAAWGAPALVLELSSSSDDAGLFVSPDGLTMWLSSNRPGGRGGYDIYRAERPSRTAGFGTPVLVSEFSSGGNDLSPTVHGWGTDRVEVFLVRAGTGGDLDLFRAVTTPAGAGPAEPVPELNSADGDDCGRISEDGLLLLLCSRRDGVADWNLFVAQRPTLEEPFATPVPLAALNTPGNEREAALLPDNRNVVFARDGELFTRSADPQLPPSKLRTTAVVCSSSCEALVMSSRPGAIWLLRWCSDTGSTL